MIGKAIYNLLSTNAGVSAIVGNKIFPVVIEQEKQPPAITYRLSGKSPNETKTAVSSLDRPQVEITAVSVKYEQLDDMAEKIRLAIDGKKGVFGGVNITNSYYIDEEDDYDQEARAYLRVLTFQIWIKRN